MSPTLGKDVTSSLSKMQLSALKAERPQLADSWEDEAEGTAPDHAEGDTTPVRPGTSDIPRAPPPTPASPSQTRERDDAYQTLQSLNYAATFDPPSHTYSPDPSPRSEERRPDKTTSVASRLIAAGIGQKAPKRTPEQREYDQAMKIQEKKKRVLAKEEEEKRRRDKEQAQKDIWGD